MKIELLKNKVFLDNEGLKKEIHPFWLRERVNSDIHVDKATQQRLFDPTEIKAKIRIKNLNLSKDHLEITFDDGVYTKLAIQNILKEFSNNNLVTDIKKIKWDSSFKEINNFEFKENLFEEKTMYQGNEVGVMHACGHDAHIAVLLGVASFLSQNTDKLSGDIFLIFQPAEEGAPEGEEGGAELMLKEGLFEAEKPDAIFGLHVSNGLHGGIMLKPGPAMASAEAFRITIEGEQTHGSRPWSGIDPIVTASDIVSTLQTIVSRRLNLLESQAVVTVGIMKAGTRNNIIPSSAMLEGTIRTFEDSYTDQIRAEIKLISENVAEAHGAKANVEFKVYGGYPVTFNDLELSEKYASSLSEAADGKYYEARVPRTGAEDFSFYAQQVPGLFFFLGVNAPGIEDSPTNHSPYFYVDDNALSSGVKAFINLVEDYSSDFNAGS